ncbi:MAG: HAD family hydrolase [Firmicutes bacterium]|jgi:beta-phosphoglucomutase family hydrolase|nr:HAD family hydrolase [Bacillota bacterium]
MIKAFIFDMDGVIVDSEPLHFEVNRRIMRDFGLEFSDEFFHAYVGITNEQMWADLIERYSLNTTIEELQKKDFLLKKEVFRDLQPIKGIPELLANLKKDGIAIGLASSSEKAFIEMVLEELGIRGYFQAVVSGEEVERSKPEPEIFLRAAELLNVDPADCLVLEDSRHGVEAAKRAGMKCIGYQNPNSGPQDLSRADKIVHTLENLDYRDF